MTTSTAKSIYNLKFENFIQIQALLPISILLENANRIGKIFINCKHLCKYRK